MLEEARTRNAQNRQIQRERERGAQWLLGGCVAPTWYRVSFWGDEGVLTFPPVMMHSPMSALEPRRCALSLSTACKFRLSKAVI